MINVEIEKHPNENTAGVIRRFTKRMQSSGVLQKARSLRYYARPQSAYTQKKQAIKKINRRQEIEKLFKLGKLKEPKKRGGRR